jgi:hypothetical protein
VLKPTPKNVFAGFLTLSSFSQKNQPAPTFPSCLLSFLTTRLTSQKLTFRLSTDDDDDDLKKEFQGFMKNVLMYSMEYVRSRYIGYGVSVEWVRSG